MYHPESFCKGCGEGNHHRTFCPSLPCAFCKIKGHIISDCPRCPVCEACGAKGHKPGCSTRSRPSAPYRSAITPKANRKPPLQSVQPSSEQSTVTSIDQGIQGSHQISASINFPRLHDTTQHVVNLLSKKENYDIPAVPYASLIEAYGGPDKVTSFLMSCVDPYVKALESKTVTVELLDNIGTEQSFNVNLWVPNSGYLDYITDDRNKRYWRPYVGQSENPKNRLAQHVNSILQLKNDTLHYHVVWKGDGQRAANFIRLWTLNCDPGIDPGMPVIFSNILEMIMCRAFQSLPPSILEKYFGQLEFGSYTLLGLNVVPPLYQSVSLGPITRKTFSLHLEDSPDPDIREWPSVRKAQGARTTKKPEPSRPVLTREYCHGALNEAIDKTTNLVGLRFSTASDLLETSISIDSWLNSLESTIRKEVGECSNLVRPVGTPEAHIGIVLDQSYSEVDPKNDVDSRIDAALPWGIRETGFNESNMLIWPFNLRGYSLFRPCQPVRSTATKEMEILRNFHRELIRKSKLRIVLMCGANAKSSLMSPDIERNPVRIQLSCAAYDGFLEIKNGKVQRIYLLSPAPLLSLWTNKWRHAQKISELFHFVVLMTQTPGIYPYFMDSSLVLTRIIRLYHSERNGEFEMTLDTIEPNIRTWLSRKGFTKDEDIELLAKKGNSLTHSLLMLLNALPHCPTQFKTTDRAPRVINSLKKSIGSFDSQQLQDVKTLYQQIAGIEISNSKDQSPSLLTVTSQDDTPDLDDLDERLEIAEQDNQECSGILVDDQGRSQITIEARKPARTTREYVWSKSARVSSHAKKTQDSLLAGRSYKGTWESPNHLQVRVHTFLSLNLPFVPREYENVIVQVEIYPKERNPNVWATEALDTDPAARLAFRVTINDSGQEGGQIVMYPTNNHEFAPHKANAFVDWMAGDTSETIVSRSRRFEKIPENVMNVPDHLKPFVEGAYTDDDGNIVPRKRIKRKDRDSKKDDEVERKRLREK